MNEFPENVLELINKNLGGFNNFLGLRFTGATPLEFTAELDIKDNHLQPYGLVHGGIYSGMIETVCSTGSALTVWGEEKNTVGLENATSFLKAVRSGRLRCTARPLALGKRSHVWEAGIHDDQDRLVATGRVRMMILEPGAEAAGEKVKIKDSVPPSKNA
ncbi:MAG: PaaI family thioesterase [Deltaproteobacteria bacterium]|nr:PaaI family thioesterase [Deltaproteobacteria bacterium]